jgi:hypothetical protein
VGAAQRDAGDDLGPFGYHVLDGRAHVGEGGHVRGDEPPGFL